jgi:hypothetical protein
MAELRATQAASKSENGKNAKAKERGVTERIAGSLHEPLLMTNKSSRANL